MACTHCPQHCPRPDISPALILDGPPSRESTPDVNLVWYRTFAMAYEAARTARLRPRQALMAANPWMSASQCSTYLKRARGYGLVSAPARSDAGRSVTSTTAAPAAPTREAPAGKPATAPHRGRRSGRLQVQTLTGEQCAAILYAETEGMELLLDNASAGKPVTAEKLRHNYDGKLSDREATDVLRWAVSDGAWQWSVEGESILPVDG
jgi:hypothetical protein